MPPILRRVDAILSPVSYILGLNECALKARANAGREAEAFGYILSIATFTSEDEAAPRSAARYSLAFFAQLPNYRWQWWCAGFKTRWTRCRQSGNRVIAEKPPHRRKIIYIGSKIETKLPGN